MCNWFKKVFPGIQLLALIATLAATPALAAQEQDLSLHWDGVWKAEGTLFTIAAEVSGEAMHIRKIETMGFEWSNEDGQVDGNIVKIAVAYAGVTGIIQAELIDANTAVAFASTCLPEYMVVCALAKGQQAVFRKIDNP